MNSETRISKFLENTPTVVIRPDFMGHLLFGAVGFLFLLTIAIGLQKLELYPEVRFLSFGLLTTFTVIRIIGYRIEITNTQVSFYQILGKRTIPIDEIRALKARTTITFWESRIHPPFALYVMIKGKKRYQTYINGKLFSFEDLAMLKSLLLQEE